MKAIVLMFDSLNRHMLPCYGCDWIKAPNFSRLARRSVTFDNSYVCSMPCMPARRDFHTGRPNFLHRPWGPLEPFDDSVPQILHESGISSHLVTDHYHYFEDGGCTYHPRYSTWQGFRGQENDPWIGQVAEPHVARNINGRGKRQGWVNRQFLREEKDFPQVQTVEAGLDFIERNHAGDSWFLQIETFDPHEPFISPSKYQELYARAGEEPLFDWPAYADVNETPEEIERARHNYAALLSLCDESLGRVLDAMDRHDLWKDTMLIVWTDHGFLLGEHNRWAKNVPTMWNEIARTPFFMWDPRHSIAGERRAALVQPAIDLGPTLLEFFGLKPTADMTGRNLSEAARNDSPVREASIFGYFGMPLNVTDGRYIYMRDIVCRDEPIYAYTWMPTHMVGRWAPKDMAGVELVEPLAFSKGMKVCRFPRRVRSKIGPEAPEHLLFELDRDPAQAHPITDEAVTRRMIDLAIRLMKEADAQPDQFRLFGLA